MEFGPSIRPFKAHPINIHIHGLPYVLVTQQRGLSSFTSNTRWHQHG